MKISEVVKKLNAVKKEQGDIDVVLDLKEISDFACQDYNYETDLTFKMNKIKMLDADTEKPSRKKYPVLSISVD